MMDRKQEFSRLAFKPFFGGMLTMLVLFTVLQTGFRRLDGYITCSQTTEASKGQANTVKHLANNTPTNVSEGQFGSENNHSHAFGEVSNATTVLAAANNDAKDYNPHTAKYLAKSAPLIVPGGEVVFRDNHLQIFGTECLGPICNDDEQKASDVATTTIEGDVIVSHLTTHYFHFVYETVLRLWGLRLHGTMDKYPNATILWFGSNRMPKTSVEMMSVMWPDFPVKNFVYGKQAHRYKADDLSTMILTRHNDYHNKKDWQAYNFWLINSMRETFDIVENPQEELFISRRGNRRAIDREEELFRALQSFLPNLRLVLPEDFSQVKQARLFANAKLIIAPHGASLTNALFSNWDKMVLIEFTKSASASSPVYGTYRNDLQVKQHYLLKCESVECPKGNCKLWDTNIDVNVQNATDTIKLILGNDTHVPKDFFISKGEILYPHLLPNNDKKKKNGNNKKRIKDSEDDPEPWGVPPPHV